MLLTTEMNRLIEGADKKKVTGTVYDQIGTKVTIQNVQDIAKEWNAKYPNNPLEIGDISLQGGLNTADHKGHQNGKIVDIRPIRTDDKLAYQAVKSAKCWKFRCKRHK
jgi:Penicillin-insensitive murein endopeptidase